MWLTARPSRNLQKPCSSALLLIPCFSVSFACSSSLVSQSLSCLVFLYVSLHLFPHMECFVYVCIYVHLWVSLVFFAAHWPYCSLHSKLWSLRAHFLSWIPVVKSREATVHVIWMHFRTLSQDCYKLDPLLIILPRLDFYFWYYPFFSFWNFLHFVRNCLHGIF